MIVIGGFLSWETAMQKPMISCASFTTLQDLQASRVSKGMRLHMDYFKMQSFVFSQPVNYTYLYSNDEEGRRQGRIQGGDRGDCPPKTCESNFIQHNFVQFVKQHSRYKATLSSIVLSQECCEDYFILVNS